MLLSIVTKFTITATITLAIDLASGVIGESLSDDKKASAIVDRFLAELEANDDIASAAGVVDDKSKA